MTPCTSRAGKRSHFTSNSRTTLCGVVADNVGKEWVTDLPACRICTTKADKIAAKEKP